MKFKKGFTMLELLIVIAIIGILSSIVLSSLTIVRNKAKNVVIKEEVNEISRLIELEHSFSGSYSNLQKDFLIPSIKTCEDAGFSGNYADQVKTLCAKILTLAPDLGGNKLIISNNISLSNKYSIMATLWTASSVEFYCVGSSGKYEGPLESFDVVNPAAGCYWNP